MEFKSQSFTVSDLYNWYRGGELFLQPKFQRRKIWKPAAKSYLLDTVLRGLPMPKIYYRMQVNSKDLKSTREVVDGQQRLDAIFGFIENQFTVRKSHNLAAAGKTFKELPESIQSQILSYDVATDLLIGADDAQVLQIFARINSYSLTLNGQEKRNAKYFGLFKEAAYRVGTTHVAFWTNNGILTDGKIARMAEAELTSELLVALIAGLQDKKKSLDKYYELYEEKFPNQKSVEAKFERTLSWIADNAAVALKATVFERRALFYSLFVVVADALFGVEKGKGPLPSLPKKTLSEKQRTRLRHQFVEITKGIRADEPPAKLVEFANASASQTDNLKPRQTRHNYLFKLLSSL